MPNGKNDRNMESKRGEVEGHQEKSTTVAVANGRAFGAAGNDSEDCAATADDCAKANSPSRSPSTESKGKKPCSSNNKNTLKRLRHASTTSESYENSSDISSTLEREPPDGGWGWVVVGAAFFVNLIADGVTFSFGVFYAEFSEVFKASKGTTAWIGSLLAAMPLLSGPIASSLTDRFGCRVVTICGGLLASLGFVLSAYAESIHMLMLTFGIITGFGLSLCYVAAVVIVAYYFERKRSFATGLSVCGGGIGTFLFAPLSQYLIKQYGWRGTTLILAGCFLSLCICGVLMKDLEWTKRSSRKREKALQNEHDFNTQAQLNLMAHAQFGGLGKSSLLNALKNDRLCNSAICIPTFLKEQERNKRRSRYFSSNYTSNTAFEHTNDDLITKNNTLTNNILSTAMNSNGTDSATEKDMKDINHDHDSSSANPTTTLNGVIVHSSGNSPAPVVQAVVTPIPDEDNENDVTLGSVSSTNHLISAHSNNLCTSTNNNVGSQQAGVTMLRNETSGSFVNGGGSIGSETNPQQKQQAMKNYVVHHTRNRSGRHRHSLTYRGAVLNLKRYRLRPASSCPDIISVATTDDRGALSWKAVYVDAYIWIREIFAWDNLSNTRFLLFILSNFLLYTWYDIPYTFLPDCVTELGYTKQQGSWLGGTIGICNVIGNIILGYIGDKKWANSITVYGVCISICGAATALMPYFISVHYYTIAFLCGVFGMMVAANYSLTPVILVKVVSLEKFANAYGLLLLVQGIGNLIGPPIAGWLADWTKTYSWSFVVAGGGIFISNFFILAPIYSKEEASADNEKSSLSISKEVGQP